MRKMYAPRDFDRYYLERIGFEVDIRSSNTEPAEVILLTPAELEEREAVYEILLSRIRASFLYYLNDPKNASIDHQSWVTEINEILDKKSRGEL